MKCFVLLAFSVLCHCHSLDKTTSKRLDELERKMDSYVSLQQEVTRLRERVKKLEKRGFNEIMCKTNKTLPLRSHGKKHF